MPAKRGTRPSFKHRLEHVCSLMDVSRKTALIETSYTATVYSVYVHSV